MFPKKYKTQNSRRHKRLRACYLVKYEIPGSGQEPFVFNMKDISAGGVKFWTDRFIPENTFLKVSVMVPLVGQPVQALSKVVRVRRGPGNGLYYIAVNFIEIPDDVQARLNQFIEALANLPETKRFVSDARIVLRAAQTENA